MVVLAAFAMVGLSAATGRPISPLEGGSRTGLSPAAGTAVAGVSPAAILVGVVHGLWTLAS